MSSASRCQKLCYKDRNALSCALVVRVGKIEGDTGVVGLEYLVGLWKMGKGRYYYSADG